MADSSSLSFVYILYTEEGEIPLRTFKDATEALYASWRLQKDTGYNCYVKAHEVIAGKVYDPVPYMPTKK